MVWLFTATAGRQFRVNFITWVLFTCLTVVTSLIVEERLQILESTNVEIKQVLVVKSQRLEALEIEVQQLKFIVTELTKGRKISNKIRKRRENNSIASNDQPTRKNSALRTCHETRLADPSLPSGMQWIDPDGKGVGDDPIQVYCNMTTGTTSILHDSESPTNVGHCADPGCYTKRINYSATNRQISALIDLSNECHQSFRYDCNFAPFEANGIVYSWWNDKDGNPQYFWAGSNATVHTCQCGIDHNCLESVTTCNCDSTLPLQKFDSGIIVNKNLLPVTRLNFGRTWLNLSSGMHTLGRLECSGTVAINGMPSSCSDLWQIGHTLNGLYSVMGDKKIESVYCDFTKLYSQTGFQNHLGYVDVKSLPVYFYVQRNTSYGEKNVPVPFELEIINIGGAMNLTSGVFTAPRTGVYFFTFAGTVILNPGSGNYLWIALVLNGNNVGIGYSESGGSHHLSHSFQSTLKVKAGDRVWLHIGDMKNARIHDNLSHFTHFTGQLLQEEIS